jgi:hypothetical protein
VRHLWVLEPGVAIKRLVRTVAPKVLYRAEPLEATQLRTRLYQISFESTVPAIIYRLMFVTITASTSKSADCAADA